MDIAPFLDLLSDAGLVFAAVLGVLAFLRRAEQAKDEAAALWDAEEVEKWPRPRSPRFQRWQGRVD